MSMEDLKENISRTLTDTIEAGAEGVVVVGPSGFPILSSGRIKEKDREAATVFSISLENLSLSEEFDRDLTYLLGKKTEIGEPWIGGLGFRYGGSLYLGAYVRGYTLLAVVQKKGRMERVRASLMRSVGSIVSFFRELSMG